MDADAFKFDQDEDLFALMSDRHGGSPISCVIVDEVQFLTKDQLWGLKKRSDELDIPVIAYGLRADFRGEPFEGNEYLLTWADNLKEIKAICHCGRKATMVLRIEESGAVVSDEDQVVIGGNDQYRSVCRRRFA